MNYKQEQNNVLNYLNKHNRIPDNTKNLDLIVNNYVNGIAKEKRHLNFYNENYKKFEKIFDKVK